MKCRYCFSARVFVKDGVDPETSRWSRWTCPDCSGEFNVDGTCVEHCCARHGCKYGLSSDAGAPEHCPVMAGYAPQAYRCEHCPDTDVLEHLSSILVRAGCEYPGSLFDAGVPTPSRAQLLQWADRFYDEIVRAVG